MQIFAHAKTIYTRPSPFSAYRGPGYEARDCDVLWLRCVYWIRSVYGVSDIAVDGGVIEE